MAEVIRMPLLSDTMTEGKIVKWNKKVGDLVKADDSIADVETDKATMDVVGYADGTLLYIGVNEGDAAKVNDIIAIVGKPGEDIQSYLKNDNTATQTTAPVETTQPIPTTTSSNTNTITPEQLGVTVIRMPLLSDTMTSGKIVQWNKKVGDKVKSDDNLVDVETDKATMEVVGYTEGTLLHIGVKDGESANVNDIIAIIGKEGTDISGLLAGLNNPSPAAPAPASPEPQKPIEQAAPIVDAEKPASSQQTDSRLKASPLAKMIAKEKGIDLNQVVGSGDSGRITKRDIDGFKPSPGTSYHTPAARTFVAGKESSYDTQLTSMRKTIARRLGESMFTAPHFYLRMEINMDNVMSFRTQLNEISPSKISFQDILIKACALSLKQHPAVNSSWMGDFIRTYDHVHIGSAIALPEGLIVPVIKFADQKSLSDISSESKELYDKARNKKIQPQDFTGNTFTISNLGMMDIDDFTAIINPPDSCILAVGKIKEVVIKKGDGFTTTNVMKLTLSCDHRSVDGAVGAAFLQTLKKYMENPVRMLV